MPQPERYDNLLLGSGHGVTLLAWELARAGGAHDDRILGFTIIGAEAGEVMAAVEMAMLASLPYQELRDAVIRHLMIAEGLGSLFTKAPPREER